MYKALNTVIEELTSPDQMFAVSETTVRGQRLKQWDKAPATLRDFWLGAAIHGDKDYIVYQDERISYSDAQEKVKRIANWLSSNGIGEGDRVAIAMRNYPEWMLSYWAITCVGAVSVGINAWWTADELSYGLSDSETKVLICDRERLERFTEIREHFQGLPVLSVRVESKTEWATNWEDALQSSADMPDACIEPDDDACIFYTSGTTGRPKGAQLTHRGCTNNVFSTLFTTLSQSTAESYLKGEDPVDLNASDALQPASIIAAPLFHVSTNNSSAQLITLLGGKLVHMYKWDPAEALRIIEQEKITSFGGVPMMTREILTHPDYQTRDTSSVTTFGGGGAPVQPDLVDKITEQGRDAYPAQGYGLTETCGLVAGSYGIYLQDKPKAAGRIVPVFDVQAIDETGAPLPSGQIGEICLRGPQIVKGYLNRPEATAESIIEGWLHTGDIGYIDEDDFVFLVDRAKDMVLRGGENVYCSEVEIALFKFPGVMECAVFSVPDERLGEEVGAAIVPAPGASFTATEIREFCKNYISAFKIPRHIWITNTPLPRNATGKFVKRDLQNHLSTEDAE